MSIFSGIGHALGKIGKVALPIAGGVAFGPLGAAAGGALSGALSGGGVGGTLEGAALGGLGGLALRGAGGVGGLLGKIGENPALAAKLGLAGLGAIQGAKSQGEANAILKSVLARQQAEAADAARARQMLMGRLGQPLPTAPDLSAVFQSSSPFARTLPTAAPAVTAAAPPPAVRHAVDLISRLGMQFKHGRRSSRRGGSSAGRVSVDRLGPIDRRQSVDRNQLMLA